MFFNNDGAIKALAWVPQYSQELATLLPPAVIPWLYINLTGRGRRCGVWKKQQCLVPNPNRSILSPHAVPGPTIPNHHVGAHRHRTTLRRTGRPKLLAGLPDAPGARQ